MPRLAAGYFLCSFFRYPGNHGTFFCIHLHPATIRILAFPLINGHLTWQATSNAGVPCFSETCSAKRFLQASQLLPADSSTANQINISFMTAKILHMCFHNIASLFFVAMLTQFCNLCKQILA